MSVLGCKFTGGISVPGVAHVCKALWKCSSFSDSPSLHSAVDHNSSSSGTSATENNYQEQDA